MQVPTVKIIPRAKLVVFWRSWDSWLARSGSSDGLFAVLPKFPKCAVKFHDLRKFLSIIHRRRERYCAAIGTETFKLVNARTAGQFGQANFVIDTLENILTSRTPNQHWAPLKEKNLRFEVASHLLPQR